MVDTFEVSLMRKKMMDNTKKHFSLKNYKVYLDKLLSKLEKENPVSHMNTNVIKGDIDYIKLQKNLQRL